MKAETTTIQLPRTILETGADKDIEFEGTLADYLPGINRVIRTEANIIPEEAVINGSKAEVKGKAVFTLLYESDYKEKLKNEKFTTDFVQRFDIGDLPKGDSFPVVNCRCSYVGCKTLNPRRFVLRCRADIRLELKTMQVMSIVSSNDCKGAFFKSEEQSFYSYCPPIRKDFNVDESFLAEGQTPIADIIYAALQFSPPEISVDNGNALIRSNGIFKCLYEDEDGETKLYEHGFATSFNMDDELLTEDCICNAELYCGTCEVIKEQDNYGEYRIMSMHGNISLCLNVFTKCKVSVPKDMFFEDYDCNAKTEPLVYDKIEHLPKHRFNIEKVLEIPDMPFKNCTDINGEMYGSEYSADESGVTAKGTLTLNILGAEDNSFNTRDLSVSFEELIPQWKCAKECKIKGSIKLVSLSGEIADNGRIKVKATGEIEGMYCKKDAVTAITGAEVSKRETSEEGSPLIIYYPAVGETAWDIGKRYNLNPQLVLDNNGEAFDKAHTISKENTVLFM